MADSVPASHSATALDGGPVLDIATLVAEHHAVLYRYAYRLTGSVSDAEDLTQQTFLSAQLKLDQLRSSSSGRPWLFAILRNCYIKTKRTQSPLTAASLDMDMNSVPDELPGESWIDQEKLQAAINELPDEFKLVLLLFYFEECSYREIAERLSLPDGTVMSRLSRAKNHLRCKLVEHDFQPSMASHSVTHERG
jgi:RNA polymerase sigma-70 factor (ECF subfamily)